MDTSELGHHRDLAELAQTFQIESPARYSVRGEPREFAKGASQMLSALEREMYLRFYVRPRSLPAAGAHIKAPGDFTSDLSAANNGSGTWEPGWEIVSVEEHGRYAVRKDDVDLWVARASLRSNGFLMPGNWCRVRVGKEIRQVATGFYLAIGNGNARDIRDAAEPVVWLYWHLNAQSAATYMRLMTSMLNEHRVAFRIRMISDPAGYVRADAGMLYLPRRSYNPLRHQLSCVYEALCDGGLNHEVPMFTRPLAPGLAMAEDPANGLSFGQSRCRLVSQGLLAAFRNGQTSPEGRLAHIVSAFQEVGCDPVHPWLDKAGPDRYQPLPGIDPARFTTDSGSGAMAGVA